MSEIADYIIEVTVNEFDSGVILRATPCDKERNGTKTIPINLSAKDNCAAIFKDIRMDLSLINALNLSHATLNSLPKALVELNLRYLDLSFNKFKEIPECIFKGLKFLQYLNLSYNNLTEFNTEPKCVHKLRTLKLNNNNICDIPKWIVQMRSFNLEELNFTCNKITTFKFARFRQTPSYKLKRLELRNCLLQSEDLSYIKQIRTLRYLDLSNLKQCKNKNAFVNGDSHYELFIKPSWDDRLKILCLNNLQIASIPEELSHLQVLEELYLNQNDLMWLPETLILLKCLKVLEICENHIIFLPEGLHQMEELKSLRAAHNVITRSPASYPNNLLSLDLYDNSLEINDLIIDSKIQEVDLEQNYFDTALLKRLEYDGKKQQLRSRSEEWRKDGPKNRIEEDFEEECSHSTDTEISDSASYSYNEDNSHQCKENVDECWTTDEKERICDNGCTLSDNEWTGVDYPSVSIRRRTRTRFEEIYPDWMFEDA